MADTPVCTNGWSPLTVYAVHNQRTAFHYSIRGPPIASLTFLSDGIIKMLLAGARTERIRIYFEVTMVFLARILQNQLLHSTGIEHVLYL